MPGAYRTRLATPADNFFLRDLLAEILTPPGGVKPSVDEVMAQPQAASFVEGWGRPGDHGVIAESVMEPIGAAWYRVFDEDDPAAGFEGGKTPELLVAVDRAHRGRGVGTMLVKALVDKARDERNEAIGLTVPSMNLPAVSVFRACGFNTTREANGLLTMLARL